jgi:hypothetical protein
VAENLLASGAVSPPLTKHSEDSPQAQSPGLLLSYTQINCLENVHRLLKSQTNETGQKQDEQASSTNANQSVPLTRELLQRHDRRWEANCKGKWVSTLRVSTSINYSFPAQTTPNEESSQQL